MDNLDDNIIIRWTRPDEAHLFAYSHSKVEAILTCPVWGIIRYAKNLYYPTSQRAMALEAGGAMHDVFAACRLWQLLRLQHLPEHFAYHGARLFTQERFERCWKDYGGEEKDFADELKNFCFNVLNSGEFYDDPDDAMRTLSNMEHTVLRYVDWRMPQFERNPIWVEDRSIPSCRIGIEQVFDVIITYQGRSVRYIGTIDGIITPIKDNPDYPDKLHEAVIDENKTASRLDETWRKSYMVKSQPTGYITIGRMITSLVINRVRMIGVKIKQTRSSEDLQAFIEERDEHQILKWVQSLFHAHDLVEKYKDAPLTAPQYTHSCSRYFRPCAFIDLCAANPEDQEDIYGSMVQGELSPSEKRANELMNAAAAALVAPQ